MKSQNPRLERLKTLLSLEERRVAVQEELESITERMTSLRDSLFDEGGPVLGEMTSAPAKTAAPSGRKPGRPPKRSPRGALKEQIAAALESAGSAGVRVTELAKALGIKPVNIHSWFHSSIKRYPQIKKLQGGHYRLEGKLDLAAGARKRGRPPKSAAAAESSPRAASARPVGRPSKTASKKRSSPNTRRGALSDKVLGELQKAGSKGVSVRDIASKIGANYRNIYIWFATTGKKNPKVKKLAPAVYRLES